jgi:hypothetical protein
MKRRVTKQHLRNPRVVVVIALTILLVAWLIWSSLFAQPTRRDYEQALEQTQMLGQAQERLQGASSEYVQDIVASLRFKLDGSNISGDTKESAATYRQELEAYRQAAERLNSSRVSRDDDAKAAVGKVKEHTGRLVGTVQSLSDDYDELYRAYTACDPVVRFSSDDANGASRYDDVSKPCLDELDALGKSSTAELADYAKQASDLINKKRQSYAAGASEAELRAIDVQLMKLDPLSRVQQLTGELFDTSELEALRTVLERKRDES